MSSIPPKFRVVRVIQGDWILHHLIEHIPVPIRILQKLYACLVVSLRYSKLFVKSCRCFLTHCSLLFYLGWPNWCVQTDTGPLYCTVLARHCTVKLTFCSVCKFIASGEEDFIDELNLDEVVLREICWRRVWFDCQVQLRSCLETWHILSSSATRHATTSSTARGTSHSTLTVVCSAASRRRLVRALKLSVALMLSLVVSLQPMMMFRDMWLRLTRSRRQRHDPTSLSASLDLRTGSWNSYFDFSYWLITDQ